MAYQMAGIVDQVQNFLRTGVSGVGQQVASGAAPELKAAVVGAVNEVLPKVQLALSEALAGGASAVGRQNKAVFIGFGVLLGVLTFGTLGLLYSQYRRLGKCCPTR